MNANIELDDIVDEMIQEGILDRVQARTAGAIAGAKQMGQNIKGVFTGAPTKGYGQQYGEVKFNNRIIQFTKQALKDLAEFEAKYGANLEKTKMPEEAKAAAIAQIAEIKKAIATAQESSGGAKAPVAQQAPAQQTPPAGGTNAGAADGSTKPATGTSAAPAAAPSTTGQGETPQQASGAPAPATQQGRTAKTGSGKQLKLPPKNKRVKKNTKTAVPATSAMPNTGEFIGEQAKHEQILNVAYSHRGPYSYLLEQPQQKVSKADIDKQIIDMMTKAAEKLIANPNDKELLGLLQKLAKTTDPKAQYQILSAFKRLNEHLERIADEEAKLLEEGEFMDSLKANIAGAKAGIGAVRTNLKSFGKDGPKQNAMIQAKTAKDQVLINAPINNLKTKIGKNLAELNRDLKTLGFNKADDKRFEPIKQSLGTLQKTLSDQKFGEVKTKLGDIRHGIGTFVGGAIKNSVIGAGLAAAIATGGVTNPYAAKAIAGAATSLIRDFTKGNLDPKKFKDPTTRRKHILGILGRAGLGVGIGLAVQGIKDYAAGTGPFANSNAAEQTPSGAGVQQSGAGDVTQSGAGGEAAKNIDAGGTSADVGTKSEFFKDSIGETSVRVKPSDYGLDSNEGLGLQDQMSFAIDNVPDEYSVLGRNIANPTFKKALGELYRLSTSADVNRPGYSTKGVKDIYYVIKQLEWDDSDVTGLTVDGNPVETAKNIIKHGLSSNGFHKTSIAGNVYNRLASALGIVGDNATQGETISNAVGAVAEP